MNMVFGIFGRRVFNRSSAEPPITLLPKLQGIQFYVIREAGTVRIDSHEFGGSVAINQNIGTLVGLQHRLLLQTEYEKTFLLPHADWMLCLL